MQVAQWMPTATIHLISEGERSHCTGSSPPQYQLLDQRRLLKHGDKQSMPYLANDLCVLLAPYAGDGGDHGR